MRAIAAIAAREIQAFFVSAMAYVVLFVWLVLQGLTLYLYAEFFADNQAQSTGVTQTPLTLFFGQSSLFYMGLLVIVPLLTMRLLAEEKKSGTLEPLLTAPVTEWQVVLGKYAAAMVLWVALWAPTLLYVLILSQYGDVDMGVVGASYAGVFGIGLYYMALGLLMSSLARNQIVAAVLTFLTLAVLFIAGIFEMVADDPLLQGIASYVSIWGHMEDFAKGIVDSRYIVFDVTTAVLALFITVRVVQARRYD